jgi:hypothetical protein
VASCTGLSAHDSERAFRWRCLPGSPVRFVSTGLRPSKGLAHLIEKGATDWKWKLLSVTVSDGSATRSSQPAIWWNNPIQTVSSASNSRTPLRDSSDRNKIFVVDTASGTSAGFDLESNGISLVVPRSATLTQSGDTTKASLITANNRAFVWIEGRMAGPTVVNSDPVHMHTITLGNLTRHSVISSVWARDFAANGVIALEGAARCRLRDISVVRTQTKTVSENTDGAAILLSATSHDNLLHRVRAGFYLHHFGASAQMLIHGHNNVLRDIVLYGSSDIGLQISGELNTASRVLAVAAQTGIVLYGSENTLTHVTTSHTIDFGIRIVGEQQTLVQALALRSSTGLRVNRDSTLANISAGLSSSALDFARTFYAPIYQGYLLVEGSCSAGGIGFGDLQLDTQCKQKSPGKVFPITLDVAQPLELGATQDAANFEPTGSALVPALLDPASLGIDSFSSFARAWVRSSGNGACNHPSFSCRIWDFRPLLGGTICDRARYGDQPGKTWQVGDPSCAYDLLGPLVSDRRKQAHYDGMIAIDLATGKHCTSSMATGCYNPFSPDATEIIGDLIGDDDGLCEEGETCLYAKNIGGVQGAFDGVPRVCHFTYAGRSPITVLEPIDSCAKP